MPTPSKTGWTRLDMQLWEECTFRDEAPVAEMRDKTEAEWQDWITARMDRAERNRLARHAIDSKRNNELKENSYTPGGSGIPPYGSEPDDYDWIGESNEDNYYDKPGPAGGKMTFYEQWMTERTARAERNRLDGKKPTASRASDDPADHHEMDYDIFMDSMIQQQGDDLVRDYLMSDNSDNPSIWSGRHDKWYGITKKDTRGGIEPPAAEESAENEHTEGQGVSKDS